MTMLRMGGRVNGRIRRLGSLLRGIGLAVSVLSLCIGIACGGGSSSSTTGSGTPTVTSVSVVGPAYTQAGQCQNFTATVYGNGAFDKSVTWSVNGVAGGTAADGTISSTGNYCAPAQPPATNPVLLSAVASGDSTKSGSTNTRVIGIQISPSQATLYVNSSQQFNVTVT